MTQSVPQPEPEPQSAPSTASAAPQSGDAAGRPATGGSEGQSKPADPLRRSRASGVWISVVVLVVLLTLLAIFVLQNTDPVAVRFLGWSGEAPLAASLLIATAAGLLIAVVAGSLRILQLRRRVRRDQRA